ncbi:MAG TPA: hypothetical protein VH142_26015 [Polyangiaceae bacterium]|jgi:hypothetical protein|nr:hypothetical protein [Polyangiaceae bacterium]
MIGSPLVIAEKARARLRSVLTAIRDNEGTPQEGAALVTLPDPADLVITACEVNELHGTGTLLLRIFADSSSIISLRTHNFYEGAQRFGAAQLCLPLAQSSGPEISSWLRWYLGTGKIRRILCLPYTPAEVLVALVAQEIIGAPLCTYIMDDKNVCADGISDDVMRELLSKSKLRLVISPEMRDAYQRKYRMKFSVMPPVVSDEIVQRTPVGTSDDTNPRRGVLLGNIWGQRWLDLLRTVFRDSGYEVDWYCNQKDPSGLEFDRAELARDGVHLRDPIAEADLPRVLSKYPFAIVPSDPLDGSSPAPVRAIAELSLPSRMVTLMTTAHLPMLVVGSPGTCAAGFVNRFRLGTVVPYQRDAVFAAIDSLLDPATQTTIRAEAARLSESFSAKGTAEWIWDSLEQGSPKTNVYDALMPETT